MEAVADRRYIAILAALAAAILIVGSRLRPAKSVSVATPSDTVALQRRVQREDLRDVAAYLASRAQDASRHVIAIDEQRSAVSWGTPGQVLAPAEPGDPAPLVLLPAPGPLPIPPFPSNLRGERWVVLVSHAPNRNPDWLAALNSGRQPAQCRGIAVQALTVNAALDTVPLGAGLFDLDGMLAGIVADCGKTRLAVSTVSIPALLDAFRDASVRFLPRYGFDAVLLDSSTEPLFDSPGLFVREVRTAGIAYRNGLRPGDLILSNRDDLQKLLASAVDGTPASLRILRGRRPLTLPWNLAPPAREFGVRPLLAGGIPITVESGTPAYDAGLRTGDRILQIAGRPVLRAAELDRAFSRLSSETVLVVYQREDSQLATAVRP